MSVFRGKKWGTFFFFSGKYGLDGGGKCCRCPLAWDRHLFLLRLAYNTVSIGLQGLLPMFLLFGTEAILPIDLFLPYPNTPMEAPLSVYMSNLRSSSGRAFGVVHDRLM